MIAPVRIVLSGCSGGGKSTLLAELARRGWATVAEPGRAIVREELATGGTATPWQDPAAFAARVLDLAIADHAAAGPGITVFDRSILDALVWYWRTQTPLPPAYADLHHSHRYHSTVWLTPPWKAQFATDSERRHSWADALEEYTALETHLPQLGYATRHVPQLPVAYLADWFEAELRAREIAA